MSIKSDTPQFIIWNQIRVIFIGTRPHHYQTLKKAEITKQQGINAYSFDDTINQMNKIYDAIIWETDFDILHDLINDEALITVAQNQYDRDVS